MWSLASILDQEGQPEKSEMSRMFLYTGYPRVLLIFISHVIKPRGIGVWQLVK